MSDRENRPKSDGRDASTGRFTKGAPPGPGRPSLPAWFKDEGDPALRFLVEVAKGEAEDEKVSRAQACMAVIERIFGKPTQAVEHQAAQGLLARLLEREPPPIPEDVE